MNRLKETKHIYDETPIPDELEQHVRQIINHHEISSHSHHLSPWLMISFSIAASFIFFLNTSEVFAATISDLPLIGPIAKVFTINSYHRQDASALVDVKVPALKETGNSQLEQRINKEIQNKINQTVSQSEKNAVQYYRDFLNAGYDKSEFLPVIVNVDYEIKVSNEHFVSFIITKLENYVSVDIEKYFYNINLKTGEVLMLEDLYGPDYLSMINPSIKQQINERESTNAYEIFFHEYGLEFTTIRDDQPFYINDSNEVVIVFDKYEIAPGAMGFPEFPLSLPFTQPYPN